MDDDLALVGRLASAGVRLGPDERLVDRPPSDQLGRLGEERLGLGGELGRLGLGEQVPHGDEPVVAASGTGCGPGP